MKKLKKVFLVCFFSFLCFGFTKVSAYSTYSIDETILESYSVYNYVSSNNVKFEDVYNGCISSYENDLSSNKYYMCQLYVSSNKLYLKLYAWNTTKKFTKFSTWINGNYIYLGLRSNDTTNITINNYLYDLTTKTFSYSSSGTSNGHESLIFNKKAGNILYSKFSGYIPLDGMFYTNIDYLDNNSFPYTLYSSSYPSINLVSLYDSNIIYGIDYDNLLPFYALNYSLFQDWIGVSYSEEPTYTYTSKVLENGNVELTFSFEDYDNSDSPYAFTIENEVSGEEYGEENPFSSIFPKVIPYGDSYTISIPYDTYLYITLAEYNKVDNSTLYIRREIFTDVIDINNIVFANPSTPYYSIDYQSQTFIQGQFNNTQKGDTCFVKFSNDLTTRQVSCSNSFSVDFDYNGYLTFYVKRKNNIIYTRNINVLGNTTTGYPYLTYNIQKQDFYSVITFNVVNDNYDINMSYRYSLDNGLTWTDYQLITATPPTYNINIFSNSNVIFEIVNVRDLDNVVVYDSKSVYVVIDISTASGLNSSTDNIIDKFISLISLNDNLINYINLSWNSIKNSKMFLPIMIPFISSIICAIIYLIRRK